jgi:hypothetical protein
MLPSPSLGPPWLSLSLSPAFGPCGIPEELEPALELELDDDAAGAADELDDFDDEEPPPHPAAATAATTSVSPNHRRVVSQLIFMCTSFTHMDRAALGFLPVASAQSAMPRPHPPSITIS